MTESASVKDGLFTFPAVPPCFTIACALTGYQHIPRRRILEVLDFRVSSLTAPSVVHLTTCVPTFLSIRSLCKCTNCFYLHINGFLTAVFNFYLYYCFSVLTSSSDFNLFCKKSMRILFFYLPTLRKSSRIPS